MPQIALVNPRKARRRRSRRRMTAKQRMYFGKRRRSHSRRSSSHRRSRRRSVAVAAPRRRRRHARRSIVRRARRHLRRFARHQGGAISLRGFNFNSFLKGTLVPSAVGAAGALGVDLVMGYASPYLPSVLTTGMAAPLTRIAGAVALGMVAANVMKDRRVGEQVMAGAVTVLAYSWVKDLVKSQFPSLPLSEYDGAGYGMGAYVSGMGYAGPAIAFPDRSRLSMYRGSSPPWNPTINAQAMHANSPIASFPRSGGMHGAPDSEFQEGNYHYG